MRAVPIPATCVPCAALRRVKSVSCVLVLAGVRGLLH